MSEWNAVCMDSIWQKLWKTQQDNEEENKTVQNERRTMENRKKAHAQIWTEWKRRIGKQNYI